MEQAIVPKQNEKTELIHNQPDANRVYAAYTGAAKSAGW